MQLTNYTVSIFLLLCWTIGTIIIRYRTAPENNWPLIYWIAMCVVAIKFPENTWDYRYVAVGLVFALLIRFEFVNRPVLQALRILELCAFGYVLLHGLELLELL